MKTEQARVLVLTSVSHFMNDGLSAVLPLFFPLLTFLVTSSILYGAIAAAFYALSSLSSPLVSARAYRSGNTGRWMGYGLIILSLGTMGMGAALIPSGVLPSISYVLLLLSASAAGFGSSFFHPMGASIIQDTFDEEVHGMALGINGTAGSLGRALFSVISTSIFFYLAIAYGRHYSAVLGMLVMGIAGLAVAAVVLSFFGQAVAGRTPASTGRGRIPFGPILRKIWVLVAITVVRNISGTGILIFLPTYLIGRGFASYGVQLGIIMTLVLSGPVVGQPLFGRMSDRLGRRAGLFITTAGSGVFMLAFLSTSSLYPYSLAFLVLFGAFAYSGFPILLPIAFNLLQPEERAAGNGVIWAAIGLGSAAGPLASGLLAEPAFAGSYSTAFAILSALTLAASSAAFAVRAEGARRH